MFYWDLDWMVQECYDSVKDETEIKRLIECNEDPNYKNKLEAELRRNF
tara:strand:- start:707 stop:850 length:144 start_codon:yes stop_codon:yes gene_type:complete